MVGLIGTAWFWPEGAAIEGYSLSYSQEQIFILLLIVSNLAIIVDYLIAHSAFNWIDKLIAKKTKIGCFSRCYLALRNKEEKIEKRLEIIKDTFSKKLTRLFKKASYPVFLAGLFVINLIPLIPFNSAFTVAIAKLRKTRLAFEILNVLSIISGNTVKNYLWITAFYKLAPILT
jgi:hypothetical protein